MRQIFCDMDGVLVNQTGRDGFDSMPWTADGRMLWEFLKPFAPTILSMLRPDIYEKCAPQKRVWCARELGEHVPVIVTTYAAGKSPNATKDAILIDDDLITHRADWVHAGGLFIHHTSAARSIELLRALALE